MMSTTPTGSNLRRLIAWIAFGLAVLFSAAGAFAQSAARHALVIGNSDYQHTTKLNNPENDARLVSKTLQELGFEVQEALNTDHRQMKRYISQFANALQQSGEGTIGLFYYAGHGVQLNGLNYLIPVDARIETEIDVEVEGVDAGIVMSSLASAKNGFNIVIFDACRNNPFARSFRSAGAPGGLAQLDAPAGTFIAYATAPGDVALDGSEQNSPYTAALVEAIRQPQVAIEQTFKQVRIRVHQSTGGKQTPWESSSLTGNFQFNGKAQTDNAAPVPPDRPDETAGRSGGSPDLAYLDAVGRNTIEGYQAFLSKYPGDSNADRVRYLIASLTEGKMWAAANKDDSAAAYKQYLLAFPDGVYADIARAKIEARMRVNGTLPTRPDRTVPQPGCAELDGPYRITGVRSNDTLNVRRGPGTGHDIVGEIPPDGRGIHIGSCRSTGWCEVTWGCVRGWAFNRYYTDRAERGPAATRDLYHVIDHDYPDMLNMRTGPGTINSIVGRIPHNGSEILIHDCSNYQNHRFKWCRVTWRGISGWAYGRYLADESGRRPD